MTRFTHNRLQEKKGGYIALMSAIIVSLILTGLTASVSSSGYLSRADTLGGEFKRISLGIAESCVNTALLKVAENYGYALPVGGLDVPVGSETCTIESISYGTEDPTTHRKAVNIATKAQYRGAWSEMRVSATVQNPSQVVSSRGTLLVVTHVINDNNGTNQASDFTMNIPSGNPSQTGFSGAESGVAIAIDPGGYSVSATGPGGYTIGSCSGTIATGGSQTCVVTADDVRTTGTLTVVANVTNLYGGTATSGMFALTFDGKPIVSGVPTTTVGTHNVGSSGLSGYIAAAWGGHCNSAGTVNIAATEDKTCIINFQDTPPPTPACADTVVIIDRTGSLSSTDLANERVATKGLLDLYAKVPVPKTPQVGIGRFGGASGTTPDIIGTLTNVYGTDSGTASSGIRAFAATGAISSWVNPMNATSTDAAYATDGTAGDQQSFTQFGFNAPVGAVVSGIELTVNGKAVGGIATDTANIAANAVGNYTLWPAKPTNTAAGKVSAVAADDGTASYIMYSSPNTATSAQTFVFNNPVGIPASSTINSVTLYARAAKNKTTSPNPGIKLRVEKGVGVFSDDNIHPLTVATSTGFQTIPRTMFNNPFTGTQWTLAEVTNWGTLRFGVVASTSAAATAPLPVVTQLYVVVNYTTLTGAGGSVSANLSSDAGGSFTSAKSISLSTTDSTSTVGSSADTWGRSWASTDLTDANFLLRLQNDTPTGGTMSINSLSMKVSYMVASSGLYAVVNNGFQNTSSGSTDISAALATANAEVGNPARHDPLKQKVIILISDGLPTYPSNSTTTVLNASDAVKTSGTQIFTIHFGSASGRDLLSKVASGTTAVVGHQPGSLYTAGLNPTQAQIDAENADGDNFFISPTTAQLPAIFQSVGTKACPAAGIAAAAPPTTGTIIVITHVVNDNGGTKQASDFTMNVSATNATPTPTFAGAESPGVSITADSGNYNVTQTNPGGYVTTVSGQCTAQTIGAGETKTCTFTNDDIPPTPPPPPPPPPDITIGPWEQATTTSP